MQRFGQELRDQGKLLAVESLASQSGAVRVHMRQGKTQLLDGPFAEAKEMVGGFFLIDCGSLDEAIDIARRCPAAEWATVEVRAVAPCCDESHAPERASPQPGACRKHAPWRVVMAELALQPRTR